VRAELGAGRRAGLSRAGLSEPSGWNSTQAASGGAGCEARGISAVDARASSPGQLGTRARRTGLGRRSAGMEELGGAAMSSPILSELFPVLQAT
jgi:hypothetical protein